MLAISCDDDLCVLGVHVRGGLCVCVPHICLLSVAFTQMCSWLVLCWQLAVLCVMGSGTQPQMAQIDATHCGYGPMPCMFVWHVV
jgi:hypothetical protein